MTATLVDDILAALSDAQSPYVILELFIQLRMN